MGTALQLDFSDCHYDPERGRFLSEDPIGFNGGDMNLYRYVGNNSLNYTDPLGLTTYQCTRIYKKKGPIDFSHSFLCVHYFNEYGQLNWDCGGIGPSGSPFGSSGSPTDRGGLPEGATCEKDSDDSCIDDCVRRKFVEGDEEPPYYHFITSNCFHYTSNIRRECNEECPD